jgi:hypothetical protein
MNLSFSVEESDLGTESPTNSPTERPTGAPTAGPFPSPSDDPSSPSSSRPSVTPSISPLGNGLCLVALRRSLQLRETLHLANAGRYYVKSSTKRQVHYFLGPCNGKNKEGNKKLVKTIFHRLVGIKDFHAIY